MANIWRRFPSGRIEGIDFVKKRPGNNAQVIANTFFEVPTNQALTKALSDTLTISDFFSYSKSGGGGTAWAYNPADTITLNDTFIKALQLSKNDSVTPSESNVKINRLTKADSITASDSRVGNIGLLKADLSTISDSLTKALILSKAEIVVISDNVSKLNSISRADVLALSDGFSYVKGGATAYTLDFFDTLSISDYFKIEGTNVYVLVEKKSLLNKNLFLTNQLLNSILKLSRGEMILNRTSSLDKNLTVENYLNKTILLVSQLDLIEG